MFSTFPYKAIKYQFSSDLPLITLTGIGFQNITDHSYSWHNLHRHDKHCLIQYCISGQGVLTINNSTYTITAGKAFLLNIPSNSHYYLPQNSTHWKFIYLEFSPEVLPLLCKIYNKLGPVISLANYPSLLTQIANFYTKALNNKLQSVFINTKLAYNFWIDLLKYNLAYAANNLTKTDIAKNFLEQNFANSNLNIDTIAEQIGYSKYHLCKTFHKQFGISPMKYLQNLRISTACKLLINNPTWTIKKIAHHVGYNNDDYFCKVFKNLKGITPNTFRKQSIHYDTLQTIYDFSATKKNTLM